jgi:hypothetical protein
LNQINNEENIINEENDIKSDRSKKKVYNLTYYNKHHSKILEKLKETKKCIIVIDFFKNRIILDILNDA